MATYTSIAHNFTPPTATSVSSQGAGAMVLIKSITASSDSTISFVNGSSDVVLDSTYKTYIHKYSPLCFKPRISSKF
jgi:acyl-homoserine lactone acylase PvdQ